MRAWYTFTYVLWILGEIVKGSFAVAAGVYSPRTRSSPAIVEYPLQATTDLEIIVVDQNDNRPLFRHDVFTGRVVEGAAPGGAGLGGPMGAVRGGGGGVGRVRGGGGGGGRIREKKKEGAG